MAQDGPFDAARPRPDITLLDLLKDYASTDARLRFHQPRAPKDDPYFLEMKRNNYAALLEAYGPQRKALPPRQRAALNYALLEVLAIDANLKPSFRSRLNVVALWLELFFKNKLKDLKAVSQDIQNVHTNVFRSGNITELSAQLRKRGFDVSLDGPLTKRIQADLSQFDIVHTEPKHPDTQFVLHFKKFPGTKRYHLSSYDAIARTDLQSFITQDPSSLRTTVALGVNDPLTAREASNLVNRVPFVKPYGGEERWWLLDQSGVITHPKFFLEGELQKYPYKENDNCQLKAAVIDKLKHGLPAEVTFQLEDGKEAKYKIHIDQDLGGLEFRDQSGNLVKSSKIIDRVEYAEHLIEKARQKTQGGRTTMTQRHV